MTTERWYADGKPVRDAAEATKVATREVRVELTNDFGEPAYTAWDVRRAEERGNTDLDRVHRG